MAPQPQHPGNENRKKTTKERSARKKRKERTSLRLQRRRRPESGPLFYRSRSSLGQATRPRALRTSFDSPPVSHNSADNSSLSCQRTDLSIDGWRTVRVSRRLSVEPPYCRGHFSSEPASPPVSQSSGKFEPPTALDVALERRRNVPCIVSALSLTVSLAGTRNVRARVLGFLSVSRFPVFVFFFLLLFFFRHTRRLWCFPREPRAPNSCSGGPRHRG